MSQFPGQIDVYEAVRLESGPWMLDLCSCAGGCARGYQRAGFRVWGVDIEPQPRYCGDGFRQDDAMAVLEHMAAGGEPWPGAPRFAAVHGSPPCQFKARVTAWRGAREDHPDLLTPMLGLLPHTGLPWVVENLPEACPPLRADYLLCGSQFGLKVRRHRAFQLSWESYQLGSPCDHRGLLPFMHKNERAFADAMECTWMSNREARQAIPPAYTEFLGNPAARAPEGACRMSLWSRNPPATAPVPPASAESVQVVTAHRVPQMVPDLDPGEDEQQAAREWLDQQAERDAHNWTLRPTTKPFGWRGWKDW